MSVYLITRKVFYLSNITGNLFTIARPVLLVMRKIKLASAAAFTFDK
ncbi:MAG: hypothetical protein F7B59_01345 [Desulfurococcales archaeon]|nr:hypothetical protein [Desulfurococcales archaeon]